VKLAASLHRARKQTANDKNGTQEENCNSRRNVRDCDEKNRNERKEYFDDKTDRLCLD
jgi:hypothetical protein